MKKISDHGSQIWKDFEIEKLEMLSKIRGGGSTTTKNATYYAQEGGGKFDDGTEDGSKENIQ